MTPGRLSGRGWRPTTIRVRLGVALSVALLPVLILGAVQSALSFQREARDERATLIAAADRSAADARARIASAEVLLQTIGPESVGFQCAQRLADVANRIPGYQNLIRFDASGRVVCGAASVPADLGRASRPWFAGLAAGAPMEVASQSGAAHADRPALLAAVRAEDAQGRFSGAMAAVLDLDSLRPQTTDRSLPPDTGVAVVDGQGRYVSATDPAQFPASLSAELRGPGRVGAQLWPTTARNGQKRLLSTAPLVGDQVFVVISAPARGLLTWAWLNPVSAFALPFLAFALALGAVWLVAERGVVRWIGYLQRIAEIYARGRFTVRPLRAEQAPPEIRDLAEALDAMAGVIVARDASLKEHLAQKDALMREIHHRVKNNLQVISSLLNMQQRALIDPAARAAISDTRQRIVALALIYRALYQSSDLRRVDLSDFLEELIGQLATGEGGEGPILKTSFACDPLEIDPDRLAPIALFAVEAISNARKHGLDAAGLLSVAFSVSDGHARLAISDTGVAGRVPMVGRGVGRTLMTAFARQLGGEVEFVVNAEGGLTASLNFPAPAAEPDEASEIPEHPVENRARA